MSGVPLPTPAGMPPGQPNSEWILKINVAVELTSACHRSDSYLVPAAFSGFWHESYFQHYVIEVIVIETSEVLAGYDPFL